MTNKKNLTIELKNFSPSFIASREAARIVTQKLIEQLSHSNAKEVFLDFKNIIFVSRSFADEILDSIEMLSEKRIRVKIKNANLSIDKMLNLVKAKRKKILKTN